MTDEEFLDAARAWLPMIDTKSSGGFTTWQMFDRLIGIASRTLADERQERRRERRIVLGALRDIERPLGPIIRVLEDLEDRDNAAKTTAERLEGSSLAASDPSETNRDSAPAPEPAPGVSASPADAGRVEPLLDEPVIPSDGEDEEDAPHVCPGCYAVGAERCADYCPDAEMERAREDDDAPGFLRGIAADFDEDDGRTP